MTQPKPIRFPKVDPFTEFALNWRSGKYGKKRLLRVLKQRFPHAGEPFLEAVAKKVAKIKPKQAGYRYMCSNFTDEEWARYEAGEDPLAIWMDRIPFPDMNLPS
jgi:hypothetical protein